ncbi:MAG: AAA family ATPase, partial [bacterium]|nr:AAA family ATPase [bacterium]
MTQTEALSILKMGHNVYLTGAAGSGKTWLLNEYIAFLRERGVAVAVTASTGIAATHMGGLTIHAWSGIGIAQTLSDGELRHLAKKPQLRRRIERTRVLIIDEVSMLDARRFDLIERVVRFMKGNWEPFGGLQVVLSGDFFQLPPIARSGEPPVELVCASDAWRSLRIAVLYLSEQHRQTDAAYSAVLHDIRTAAVDERTLTALAARHHGALADGQRPTRLYTHNVDVDAVNEKELATIAGDPVSYHMATDGVGALARELRRGCLAPEELRVKKGALVMFVKNNVEAGYVNGTLGTVSAIDASGYPLVKTRSGREIVAEPERW